MNHLFYLAIVVAIVLFIVPILLALTVANKYIRSNQKLSKICILLYSCVLLLSPIVYFILPHNQDLKVLSKEEQQIKVREHETFAKDFIQGKLDRYSKYYLEDLSFDVKGDKLKLKLLDEDEMEPNPYVRVAVEWIQSDSQQVTAQLYRAPFVQFGRDLTNEIQQPKITWKNNHTILIQNPKVIKLNNRIITDKIMAFSIGQSFFRDEDFIDSSKWEIEHDIDLNTCYFMYLKVPNHMDILDKNNIRVYE